MNKKKTILIFCDYFLPGFKAGGPVQSIANLINVFSDEYHFLVITSAFDLSVKTPFKNININQWNTIFINNDNFKVWYANSFINYFSYIKVLKNTKADLVFFNSIYSFRFFLFPLLFKKFIFSQFAKFIISPRGILQSGSLAVKSYKKLPYLKLLKRSTLLNKLIWHATVTLEEIAIKKYFGNMLTIKIAGNIPKMPIGQLQISNKKKTVLQLVYLSTITSVKNLKMIIQILIECKHIIRLDIYGGVKDQFYWKDCQQSMALLPKNIHIVYKGDLQPNLVQRTLQNYDALVLLSTGENFGHVLFESLSVGRPIITSHFTPWNDLQKQMAGWNVDIFQPKDITALFDDLAMIDKQIWQEFCIGAHQLANNYFYKSDFKKEYLQLFN
jgi:glycosyltransferase involved in cell wall biosynthesis